jgi:hypothetical protein
MELKVFESPGKEWDEFASRYTDLIFYQSIWSEVLRKGLGGQPLYFYLKEGEEIVAGLPGVLLNFRIFKVYYASIPYGNLIGEISFFPRFLDVLGKEFQKRGIDEVRMTESPFLEPYHPEGFKSLPATCSLLDLRGFEKERIMEGYKKYIRRDIRKAQRNGVTIRPGSSREDVRIFYELYLSSMERNRAAAKYPRRWFHAIYERVVVRGLGNFLFADLNQNAIAGVVLVNSVATTHYFHNGSRPEFLRFCPNELLVHFSLEDAIMRGNSFFDFMGSDSGDLSLIKFKEKWGSRSFEIHTHVNEYHPIRCRIWELGKKLGRSNIGSRLLNFIRK